MRVDAFGLTLLLSVGLFAQGPGPDRDLKSWLVNHGAKLDELYVHLHQNPELSFREVKTAALMAKEMRSVGIEVTEHVGGNGVVGVLRCGDGPAPCFYCH